jgi:hypothetical protein
MKMTIGRKLTIGLGVMLVMVVIMSSIFFWATKGAEKAKTEALELSEFNTFFSERVIDHLKWMDGLTTLETIVRDFRIPVILVSSLTREGAER